MNKIIIIGNVGHDAELRYTQGGNAVLSFSVATTEKWSSNGEKKERTDWHSVSIWGKRGEALAKYVTKGTRVAVEGRVQYRKYEDRDGNQRMATEINASDIELLGGGDRAGASPRRQEQGGGGGYQGHDDRSDFDDDVPF